MNFKSAIIKIFILWCWMSSSAEAHKVNIFAWVEGDKIYTQSKFSGGRPAQDCLVTVADKQGNILLEGKTDDKGEFSFQIPVRTDLIISLKASMGHLAEWTISAEDIAQATTPQSLPTQESRHEISSEPKPDTASLSNQASSKMEAQASQQRYLDQEMIQKIIDESLDKKLAPITRMLVQLTEPKPGFTEIIGGIGYIIGLVGIAMYIANRKKGSSC